MQILPIATAVLFSLTALDAKVTRVIIDHRESPAYSGKVFGKAGQYELLTGHFTGELDPKDPHNAIINDIALAPRNANELVEYTATFAISKPIDMSKTNGVLMYSVPNRGRGTPAPGPDGRVSVVSGWQGDLEPAAGSQTIAVPVAKDVTGPVWAAFIDSPAGAHTLKLSTAVSAISYQLPMSLDTSKAALTKRFDRIFHQHRHRHRPDTAGHGGDLRAERGDG